MPNMIRCGDGDRAVGTFPFDTRGVVRRRAAVNGWYSGVAADSEDTLAFSQLKGVSSSWLITPAMDRRLCGAARRIRPYHVAATHQLGAIKF